MEHYKYIFANLMIFLSKILHMLGTEMIKRYLSPKELSEYIGISIQTIYEWTSQRRIPFIKVKRLVKFDIMVVDDWMKSQVVKPYQH